MEECEPRKRVNTLVCVCTVSGQHEAEKRGYMLISFCRVYGKVKRRKRNGWFKNVGVRIHVRETEKYVHASGAEKVEHHDSRAASTLT